MGGAWPCAMGGRVSNSMYVVNPVFPLFLSLASELKFPDRKQTRIIIREDTCEEMCRFSETRQRADAKARRCADPAQVISRQGASATTRARGARARDRRAYLWLTPSCISHRHKLSSMVCIDCTNLALCPWPCP